MTDDPASYSGAPFGNATAAADGGVASAFTSTPSPSGSGLPEFQWFTDSLADAETAVAQLFSLGAAGWLDDASRDVRVQIALLNGQVAMFARVELVATFTRGSRVGTSFLITSAPVDPYNSQRGIIVLDIVLLLYWVYLLFGTLRRLVKAARTRGTLSTKLASFFSYWRLLDTATTASLLGVIITWSLACSRLSAIRQHIASTSDLGPTSFSSGPSDLQWQIFDACSMLRQFKAVAVVTLILLTLRVFKYFTFQPRLAIMSEVFGRAWSDVVHHSFLFGLVLAMYGLWGHFMFGNQAPDWAAIGWVTVVQLLLPSIHETAVA